MKSINVAMLLAAGHSSRFNGSISKLLYKIKNKPLIAHSVDNLLKVVDKMVIVVNSKNHQHIKKIFNKNKRISFIVNDIDERLESINKGRLSFTDQNISNIIIQDAARPYVTVKMLDELLVSSQYYLYSQYYLNMINGLAIRDNNSYHIVDRSNYIETCNPLIIDYLLFNFLFARYIYPKNRISCEILPVINKFNIPYNLIEGDRRLLRKVTTINDIY